MPQDSTYSELFGLIDLESVSYAEDLELHANFPSLVSAAGTGTPNWTWINPRNRLFDAAH